jgi:hypothetical protein
MTLEKYISDRLETPFVWGENDCVLFAIGWLNIRAEKNWLAALPHWTNAREAIRIVNQLGGLEAEFDRRLQRVSPSAARDGDIALIKRTVFLFSGPHIVAPGPTGLNFFNRTYAPCAWSC